MRPADLMYCLFDILIRSLRLFRVDDINIVVFLYFTHLPLHFVCVKNKDQRLLFIPLVIAEYIHQFVPGRLNIHL